MFLITIGASAASEDIQADSNVNEVMSVDEASIEDVRQAGGGYSADDMESQANDEKLSASSVSTGDVLGDNPGNFIDLSNVIRSNYGGTADLYKNYTRSSADDIYMVDISREITVDGHGNTIDSDNGKGPIFQINTHSKVLFKNIIFTGATENPVDFPFSFNVEFVNCTFKDMMSVNGIIYFMKSGNLTFINSTFINNTVNSNGGTIYGL